MEKSIDLPPFPSGWNELTAEQMVQLNRIRHEHWHTKEDYLFHAFCYFTGLELVSSTKDEQDHKIYIFQLRDKEVEVSLEAWEIQFFISNNIKWITEECTRLADVFPTLILKGKTFGSPGYAMTGMTYQQYKKAQDYMVLYCRLTNQLVELFENKTKTSPDKIEQLIEERKKAKSCFLASVYTPETRISSRSVDGQTVVCDPPERAFVFSPAQISMYSSWFEELPDEKGDAVIQLFTGVMLNYRKMFPLLFPEKDENQGANMNFIQIESSTMNALQTKLGFNNFQTIYDSNAPFILDRLHAIIKEGKALDEQHRKMKSKRK